MKRRSEARTHQTNSTEHGSWRQGRNLYHDPWMLAQARLYPQTLCATFCPRAPAPLEHTSSDALPRVDGPAQALAVHAQGRPAHLLHRLGAGNVLFSAYPLETCLNSVPDVHLRDATCRLYAAAAALSSIQPLFSTGDPWILVGYLRGRGLPRMADQS